MQKYFYFILLVTINIFAQIDKQVLCDKFYAIDNEITITIDIATSIWNQLRNDNPDKWEGETYTEFTARSIAITGSEFPVSTISYSNPKLKGKGTSSHNSNRPSMKIEILQEDAVENQIGTHKLVMNNSHQDISYIRQILQNKLCQYAGLPYQRCNFAKVIVKDGSTILMSEVYVNIENIGKRFIKNNFSCNPDVANLYELEGSDLPRQDWDNPNPWPQGPRSFQGWSNYPNVDLNAFASFLNTGYFYKLKVKNRAPNYFRFWAMEILLKHWDGNSCGMNNTYIYNDTIAVQNPTLPSTPIKLNFIMTGTDQILQSHKSWNLDDYTESFLASKMAANSDCLNELKDEIWDMLDNIFSPEFCNKAMLPFIEKCRTVLHNMGHTQEFASVINQLKLVYSEGYRLIGETAPQNMNSTVWLEDDVLPAGANWAGESEQVNWVNYPNPYYSGSKAHQTNNVTGTHQHYFNGVSNSNALKILNGEELYTHVFLDPTNPPQEVMIQWHANGWNRAYWGANKINWNPKTYMGPLPPTGTWAKLSVPSSIAGTTPIKGFAYSLYGGKSTWDATGVKKMYAWVDDEVLPEGGVWQGNEQITWVTSPVFSGEKARQTANQAGLHYHFFENANNHPMRVEKGGEIYIYIYLDSNFPPQEIMIQVLTTDAWKYVYWGNNTINWGPRVYMGPIPETGKWVKLIIPENVLEIDNNHRKITGLGFALYGGKATWDASGVDYSNSILNW